MPMSQTGVPPSPPQQLPPNLPCFELFSGNRINYRKYGVPLFEASITGDWKAAKTIFDEKPELKSYSITENGETALHVAASANISKHRNEFVRDLVNLMSKEDLALQNKNYNTALYLAAAGGNITAVKIMASKNRELLTIAGAGGSMMPLNAASLYGFPPVVKYLYENSYSLGDENSYNLGDTGWTNQNRGVLFETCIENDMFDVALRMVNKRPEMCLNHGVLAVLARKPDAFSETKSSLTMRNIRRGIGLTAPEKESDGLHILRIILQEIVKNPENEIDHIFRGPHDHVNKKPVSDQVDQALELQKLISEHIVNIHNETHNIIKQDVKTCSGSEDQSFQLEKVISENIGNMQAKTQNIIRGPATKETHSSHVLFIAAEMGNIKFVVELIRHYPELMWKVNDNNQTIFHIAVEHRHESIFNILYEIGSTKDSITSIIDNNDNNMLHLVGKIAKKNRLEEVLGVAFQMQLELLWFKEVENMVPRTYRRRRNKDGLTAYELFIKEHEDLLAQSEKWLKGTSNQGMIIATLVATISFGAAITVPGGYTQNNGIPIFYKSRAYIIFILADAMSMLSSTACTLLFITILTSRFAIHDFMESLPKKLLFFISLLFYSIITMMISFCASFFVIYPKEMKWIPIVISSFSSLPILLYTHLQFGLFQDLNRSTFGSSYLFHPYI